MSSLCIKQNKEKIIFKECRLHFCINAQTCIAQTCIQVRSNYMLLHSVVLVKFVHEEQNNQIGWW